MFVFGKPGSPDLNTLLEYFPAGASDTLNGGNRNLTGKTARNVPLDSAKKNLVLVVAGQSNTCCVVPSAYTPSNPSALDNFSIYDGGIYVAADPELGCSTSTLGPGNAFLRLADTLVTNGKFDRVILVMTGIGATTIAMWAADSYNRIAVAGRRLAAANLLNGSATVAVAFQNGETDTTLGTTQPAFTTGLNGMIANYRKWHNGPIFVAESTFNGTATSSAIQAAQTGIVTNVPNGIWSLGNMDSNTTTWRQPGAGEPHLNDTGSAGWAALMTTSLAAYGAPF